jgi:hypothetical protein
VGLAAFWDTGLPSFHECIPLEADVIFDEFGHVVLRPIKGRWGWRVLSSRFAYSRGHHVCVFDLTGEEGWTNYDLAESQFAFTVGA